MRATPRRLVLTLALALALPSTVPMFGPAATMQQAVQSKRPIELQDIINWKSIGTTAVSNDGQWFAYRIAPGEGDAQIVVKRARGGEKELTFEVGELPTAGAAGGGRGGDAGRCRIRDARFLRRFEVRRLHDLSFTPRGAAPSSSAPSRPEQRDDRQPGDEREARVPAHPPVRVLGRCVDVDCAAASGGPGGRRGGCGRRARRGGRRCADAGVVAARPPIDRGAQTSSCASSRPGRS